MVYHPYAMIYIAMMAAIQVHASSHAQSVRNAATRVISGNTDHGGAVWLRSILRRIAAVSRVLCAARSLTRPFKDSTLALVC